MFRTFLAASALALVGLAHSSPAAFAGEQPNLMIMGEDADLDTVPRGSRIFNRVLNAISTELETEGFRVYDETAITMDITNPNRVLRDDSELITIAKRVPSVPIDAVAVFQIYASAEKNTYADITDLRVRVSGRMLNVNTGKTLGNYEVGYAPGDLPPLPANCNRDCVLEFVGDQASRIGSDVGAVLASKLDAISPAAPGATTTIVKDAVGVSVTSNADDKCSGLTTAYTLSFKGFGSDELTQIEEYLVAFKGYDHHRPLKTDSMQADYWYETCSDEARLNRNLRLMAEHMGVEARISKTKNIFDIELMRAPKTR
ncbi:MAG: hypothetical protein KC592_12740 [Nitrospira sp.]|nr:hypothetical protein [Nitrospira sp.]